MTKTFLFVWWDIETSSTTVYAFKMELDYIRKYELTRLPNVVLS